MPNTDTPALNNDGTLKDASELEWLNSPSDEKRTVSLDDLKKRKRADSVADENSDSDSDDTLPRYVPRGLKGKSPARQVAGKRVKKLSDKGKYAVDADLGTSRSSINQCSFFQRQFTVGASGSKDSTAIQSTSVGSKQTSSELPPTALQHPPTRRRANSAPPSPEKCAPAPSKQKATTKKSNTKRRVFESEDKADEFDDDGGNGEDSEKEKDPLAEYERMREDIQKERLPARKHFNRGEDPHTQDIRAVFTPGEITDKATDKVKKGHFCNACIAKGASKKASFFAGDNSTLRTHIRRFWPSHGDLYLQKCRELKIQPNPRAMPEPEDDKPADAQASLDGYIQVKSNVKWSKQGLMEHILDFVVSGDQSFRVVDEGPFRKLLKYQRPATQESDIPHRTKLRNEIIEKANAIIQRLKEKFKDVPGQISITFDAWTSKSYDPYLSITAHYIDAPPDKPLEWELKSKLLGFEELKGSHTGANIATKIVEVLDQYEIRDKLGWCTADNASANDKAMRVLQKSMPASVERWHARDRRVRCMEHTVYLAAKAFIEKVKPKVPKSTNKKTTKNGTASVEDTDDEDDVDIEDQDNDEDNNWVSDWAQLDAISDDQEIDDVADFTAGDVLGKTLALVNQIRASPQAKAYFASCCESEGVPILELIKWVRTRWGSMYDLVARFIACKPAIQKFCVFADDKLPKLKNKKYIDDRLGADEWKILELIKEVLEEPRFAQASFSSETEPTLWKAIPILELLQSRWEIMLANDKFSPVRVAIEKGLEKFRKWYMSIDESDTYFICLALHPSIKLEYCKKNWDDFYYKAGYTSLEDMFKAYYIPPKESAAPAASTTSNIADTSTPFKGYGSSWLLSSLGTTSPSDSSGDDPLKELKDYLNSRREMTEDPVKWWGYHSQQYPTLARIARDYLAIQGSSVASERSFSSSGLTDTLWRNRMEPKVFGKVQIIKNAYKSHFIDVEAEAAAHNIVDYIQLSS